MVPTSLQEVKESAEYACKKMQRKNSMTSVLFLNHPHGGVVVALWAPGYEVQVYPYDVKAAGHFTFRFSVFSSLTALEAQGYTVIY